MDYTTSPVQVTPGPQPAASGPPSANPSGSGILNFNGFLQSASSETATGSTTDTGVAGKAEHSSANGAIYATRPIAANAMIAAQQVANESDGKNSSGTPGGFLQSSQSAANTRVIATTQTNGSVMLSADSPDGDTNDAIELVAMFSNGQLRQALAGDAGARHSNEETRDAASAVPLAGVNGELADNIESSALISANTDSALKSALLKSGETVNAIGQTSTRMSATSSAASTGADVVEGDTVLKLSAVKSAHATTVAGNRLDDSVISTPAFSTNDSLLKADKNASVAIPNGGNSGQTLVDAITVSQPRGPIAGNMASEPRVMQIPSGAEISSPQGNGIAASASIATTGIAQGLVSRQRNGAANDDSVSQIARGGNEARLLELSGAKTTSAATHGNTAGTSPVETKTELDAKLTNAVALAATRDEKSSRGAVPIVNQTQMAARIGGVDVTQIATVDFATAQVDTAPATQAVSRVAILEPGWTNQLGSDLRALVARGTSTTQLQVTPAELGPLDIEVSVNRQEVSVRILAMHGQTREMLEAALPRLREALGQSYSSVEVSVGSGSGNSSSQGQNQHAGGQTGTMAMMSDAQGGLRDSASTQDSGLVDGDENADGSNELTDDDSISLADGSPVVDNLKPSRGLVDAYA